MHHSILIHVHINLIHAQKSRVTIIIFLTESITRHCSLNVIRH